MKILDPRLSTVPVHEVMHVFYVALLCTEEHSVQRPTMREVVQILSELPKPAANQDGEEELPLSCEGPESNPPAPTSYTEAPAGDAKDQQPQQQHTSSESSPPDLISI